ncbi:hypothetical protein CCACVL1_26795, partial [Corchorus capsularis]
MVGQIRGKRAVANPTGTNHLWPTSHCACRGKE